MTATEAPPVDKAREAGLVYIDRLDHNDRVRLKALCRIASTDASRPVLGCIAIDHRGLWAIDGVHLGHVPAWTGLAPGDRRLVLASRLKQALNQATLKTDSVHVHLGAGESRFIVTRASRSGSPKEVLVAIEVPYPDVPVDHFPNVDALLPEDKARTLAKPNEAMVKSFVDHGAVNVNVDYLANVAALSPSRTSGVTLVPSKDDSPLLAPSLVYDDSGRWLGLVMPRRYGVVLR